MSKVNLYFNSPAFSSIQMKEIMATMVMTIKRYTSNIHKDLHFLFFQ